MRGIIQMNLHADITCVSAFLEILLSLQCKIFQYTFLEQYPMEFQDFFSLCQIQQLTLLQLDHRKLGPSEIRLLSDPCIIKLKRRKNTLSCVICCFEKHFLGFLLNLICIKIAYNIFLYITLVKPLSKVKSTKSYNNQELRSTI